MTLGFLDLFSEKSDLYASSRPTYPEALFQFVANAAPARDLAWNCATGSGQAAIGLAGHFGAVRATDASADQVRHGAACEGVSYSVQPAEQAAFTDGVFDAICVSQALHWFDISAFFLECRRVLAPDGILVVCGYDWFQVNPEIDEVFQKCIMEEIESDWAPQNALLWNGYRDVEFPIDQIETPKLSIEEDWYLYQLLAYVHTWSSVRRCMARQGTAFFEQAGKMMAEAWGDPGSPRTVQMPMHLIAGTMNAWWVDSVFPEIQLAIANTT